MSDSPRVVIKSSKIESTENGENSRSSPVPSSTLSVSPRRKPSDNEILPKNSSFFRRNLSKRFSRSCSQRSETNPETIILEEAESRKRQPVILKASFLRRKIEEYEGKQISMIHTNSKNANIVIVISKLRQ